MKIGTLFRIVLGCALSLLIIGPAWAANESQFSDGAGYFNQAVRSGFDIPTGQMWGQTFNITVGSYTIQNIDIKINRTGTIESGESIRMMIYPTGAVNESPTGSILEYSNVLAASTVGNTTGSWVRFTFNNSNIYSSGKSYMFIVSSNGSGNLSWGYATTNPYTKGSGNWKIAGSYTWGALAVNSDGAFNITYTTTNGNLAINASDIYDGTVLNTFSALINGTLYNTTNGTINTNINASISPLLNVTIISSGYFNRTYENMNATLNINLASQLWQSYIAFNSTEIISGNNVTEFSVTTTNQSNNSATPILLLKAGTYNITFSKTGWFNKTQQFTVTALQNSTQTFTEVYASVVNISVKNAVSGASVNNFSINASVFNGTYNTSASTTNGTIYLPWANSTNSNFTTITAGLAITSNITNVSTSGYTGVIIYAFTSESITFKFYNENTLALLNTTTITIYLTSSAYSYNYTTSNGTLYVDLLSPQTYHITVTASGYSTRTYFYTVTAASTGSKDIYLLPNGYGAVLITIYDPAYNAIPNYYASITRKNLSGISYYEVERCQVDINGQCLVSMNVCTSNDTSCPYYRVIVYDSSEILAGDSGDIKQSSSALPLTVNSNSPIQGIIDFFGRTAYLSNFNSSGQVTFYLDNTDSIASSAEVTIVRRVGSSYATLSTTTSSGSGQIIITTPATNLSLGEEFVAYARYIDSDGITHLADQRSIVDPSTGLGSSRNDLAVFLGLGLILAPLLLFRWDPAISVVGAGAMMFLINLIGLGSFTTNAIGGVIVFGGVILWMVFK